ncbi:MAG: hypothetical protein KJ041_07660, partial [Gammaproteobacteria bacterium]|nr:hypothetical protein [Gammaproteobacteria bacterium]
EIDFKSPGDDDDDDPDGRVAANVTAVNPGAGSLVAAGVTIVVSPATRLEDQSAAGLRPFRAADINVGDFVDVRGAPGIGASLSALLLERDDASDEGRLHGPASAIAQPDLTVLGVPVTSSGATQFRDRNGNTVTATQFFQALTPGTRVRVRFSQSAQAGGAILANRLELEELDANVSCPPDPGPVLIEGNVTVTGNCTLNGTRVLGNVRVYGGGSLTTFGADIDGNIQANGASFVLVEQTAVNGDIQLDDMAGSAGSVINSTVDGNIQVFDNDVPLVIRDNLVGGDVQAFGNQGGVAINDNDINGNLQCQGNTPPPTGGNNQVNGNKENQCSGL